MSRIAARPLNQAAVASANDAFYAAHPEMIGADGERIPIGDGADHAAYRSEWMDLYVAAGGKLEEDDPGGSEDPVQPCPLSWIKFQFLASDGDLPLAGIQAVIVDPSGREIRRTTDDQGLIEIRPAEPGSWAISTPLDGRTISDTFSVTSQVSTVAPVTASQAGMPPPRPGQSEQPQDVNQARSEAMPWAPRAFAEITEHRVQDGDSLVSLAAQVGCTWEELAYFNFGVTAPEAINRQLHDLVGCTYADDNGNYHFRSSDDPGLMFLLVELRADGLAIEQTHIFRGEPVERPVKLELQTVDALGFSVSRVSLTLVTVDGREIGITSDENGYWTDTLILNGPVDVYHADGTRALFFADAYTGADQSSNDPQGVEAFPEARLDPLLVRRAISTILVPGVAEQASVERRDTLRRRYGRTRADREAAAAVSAASQETDSEAGGGDPDADLSAGAMVYRTRHLAVDNLFVHPLTDRGQFFVTFEQWLRDRHPTASTGRSFYLMVARNDRIFVGTVSGGRLQQQGTFLIDPGLIYAGDVTLPDGRSVTARNAYGAYAAFEVGQPRPIFFDLETRSEPLTDFDPTDDVEVLADVVVGAAEQQRFRRLQRSLAPRVGILYLYPEDETRRTAAALFGGCGLLENYPSDGTVASRVHARNRAAAQALDAAYDAYLSAYIGEVEAARSVAELHAVGAPIQPYRFPAPAGASDAKLSELAQDQGTTAFRAWRAVSEKLAELENRHSSGSMFIRAKFELADNVNSPVGGGSAKTSFTFDIGSDGYLHKTERALEVAVGPNEAPIPRLAATGTVQLKTELNPDTGETKDTVALGLQRGGKSYGFEVSSDGNTKFTGPYNTYSEFNSRTAEGGFGLCLSLQDLLSQRRQARGEDPEAQSFLAGIPNATFCVGLHFVLLREDQVLSFLVRAPGFFERRLLTSILRCNWHSLSSFEQAQLTVIGWDQETWDRRNETDFPAATGVDYNQLTPTQKVAAVKLGFTQLNWAPTWNGQRALARARLTNANAR